jgi:3-oxoacyl-[acyl-carrier-protein] synthase II
LNRRVVVTGMSGISPLGLGWDTTRSNMLSGKNKMVYMEDWNQYPELETKLASPILDFELPKHYKRVKIRSMGRVSQMATRVTELALEDAGLLGHTLLTDGSTGVAYGSSSGSPPAIGPFAQMRTTGSMRGITATSYIQMMSHTCAVNIGLFFELKGRVIPTCSACTSGSQAIGYAYEAIRHGYQTAMVAGGAEELCVTEAAVFDVLYATSTHYNDRPHASPRPFDQHRDGLVIGEGASTLILEDLESALARGANIHCEIVGFGTNADGNHITNPNSVTMQKAMQISLDQAGLNGSEIGYVCAHATATENGDIAETQATRALFGRAVPISSLKSYIGHTLGASGSLESWISIEMMKEGAFAPTLNLDNIDERCGELDYIRGDFRSIHTDHVMNNNFAFGGINTSLIFRRWKD